MKLPNKYGSVYKLKGKRRNPWCARKTVGWKTNPDTQKAIPVYKYIGYYPTKQDALQGLADYNNDPYDLHIKTITLEEVYERWSEEHFQKISDSNIKATTASWKLLQSLWDCPFIEIKLDHLQKVVDESGKNRPTLKKLKSTLHMMYNYAELHDIITPDRNKVKFLDIDQAGNPNAYNRQPFTTTEIDMLWKVQKSNVYYSVILMLIYTGCRIGEFLDLKKEDVHLEDKWFYVRESKTEAGIREVPIADKVVPFFEYWMQKDCDTLICTPEEQSFTYRNYYDSYWMPLVDALKMTHRPHDTRHTCISLLTQEGVDERIIRKIVGHKGQGVTETVYTHIELPIKLEAINRI